MKAFARIRQTGTVMQGAVECQERFVRLSVSKVQQQVALFEYCSISVLNRESVGKLLNLEYDTSGHSTELVYRFCKYNCIHLYVRPGGRTRIDVVTRFNRDPKLDLVFGKHVSDTVKGRAYGTKLKTR